MCVVDLVQSGFKPPAKWIGSMYILCECNQCAFDIQCGQAFRKSGLSYSQCEIFPPQNHCSNFYLIYIIKLGGKCTGIALLVLGGVSTSYFHTILQHVARNMLVKLSLYVPLSAPSSYAVPSFC